MSGRLFLALTGIVLLVSFCLLPRGGVGMVLLVAGVLAFVFSLFEVCRQLYHDVRWMMRRIAARQSPGKR
jgi:hypothetical protein